MWHTQPPTRTVLKELPQGVTRLVSEDDNSPHPTPRVRMVGDYTPNFHVDLEREQRCRIVFLQTIGIFKLCLRKEDI